MPNNKRSRADSGDQQYGPESPPRPPLQRSRTGALEQGVKARGLEGFPDEIYPIIFAFLPTSALLKLARTSHALNQKVHDYLGYRHHVVINPLAPAHLIMPIPSREQEPANPPHSYTSQGSAQMHGKLYVPVLSSEPKCYVLALDTFEWECFPIIVMPASDESRSHSLMDVHPDEVRDELSQQGPMTKPIWGPLTASVTACASTCTLYVYGGIRRPISQDDASAGFPFFPVAGSVGSNVTFGSSGSHPSGSGSNVTPLTPSDDVDGDMNLRLSSDLFRIDVPIAFAKPRARAAQPAADDSWRLWYLGSKLHPHPVGSAHRREVTPSHNPDAPYSPASSPLFNLHLDAPSPMADIERNAEQIELDQPSPNTYRNSTLPTTPNAPEITNQVQQSTAGSTSRTAGSQTLQSTAPESRASSASSVTSDDDAPPPEERKLAWPEARREHSLDCVSDEWLVMFGGRSRRGEEHSDAWAFELATGTWTPLNRTNIQPRLQYSHASAVVGKDVFVFGGCQTDSPLIIHDTLSRLSCVGRPSEWVWANYNSPALFQPKKPDRPKRPLRSASLAPVNEDDTEDAMNEDVEIPGQDLLELASAFRRRSHASNGSSGSSAGPGDPRNNSSGSETAADLAHQSMPMADMPGAMLSEEGYRVIEGIPATGQPPIGRNNSSGSETATNLAHQSLPMADIPGAMLSEEGYRVIEGIPTTGQTPIERFRASLVPLGDHKLAVVGGLTVEEGVEGSSGVVFDEFCACHISAIDIFDTVRNHWTTLRPHAAPPGTTVVPHADFLIDSTAVGLPPSHDSASWSIIVAGRALDLDEYEIPGDDFGLAAASARNAIARGDDGGSMNNWYQLRPGDEHPAQLRMDPQELLELHLRRTKEDAEMAAMSESSRTSGSEAAVRYYERDGVVCLASTFSRLVSIHPPSGGKFRPPGTEGNSANQPIGGPYESKSSTKPPTAICSAGTLNSETPPANYPTGVFKSDGASSSDGDRSWRAHVGTRQLLRVIKFS